MVLKMVSKMVAWLDSLLVETSSESGDCSVGSIDG